MQSLIMQSIATAAYAAGLPRERVILETMADNLTLPRPRLEVQFLPVRYEESGRALALRRTKQNELRKREAYRATQPVIATVFAEDTEWLSAFSYYFIQAFPKGFNDSRGNYVAITAEEATFSKKPDKRVGNTVIQVFSKVETLFKLGYVWRITRDEEVALIPSITFSTSNK